MSKTLHVFHESDNCQIQLEAKLQDLWIGAYWKHSPYYNSKTRDNEKRTDIWICLLPCLPIHITKFRADQPWEN